MISKSFFIKPASGLSPQRVHVSFGGVKEKSNLWPAVLLMIAFALSRWPGLLPDNFSAAYALAFCAGVYFPRQLAWWLPMSAFLATDVLMNVLYYHVAPVSPYMLVNYGTYAAIIGIGNRFSSRPSWVQVARGGPV